MLEQVDMEDRLLFFQSQSELSLEQPMTDQRILQQLQIDPATTNIKDFYQQLRKSNLCPAQNQAQVLKIFLKEKKIAKRLKAKNRSFNKLSQTFVKNQFNSAQTEKEISNQCSEETSRINQRQKNRLSAQISRDNKKQYLKDLQRQNRQLAQQNRQLRQKSHNGFKFALICWLVTFLIFNYTQKGFQINHFQFPNFQSSLPYFKPQTIFEQIKQGIQSIKPLLTQQSINSLSVIKFQNENIVLARQILYGGGTTKQKQKMIID